MALFIEESSLCVMLFFMKISFPFKSVVDRSSPVMEENQMYIDQQLESNLDQIGPRGTGAEILLRLPFKDLISV